MTATPKTQQIKTHYDFLSPFYKLLWGEHIHHGFFETDEPAQAAQEKLLEKLADYCGLKPGSCVLDVGCGMGGTAFWMVRRLNAQVTGITISDVQVQIARWKARRCRIDRAEFLRFDAHELSTMDKQFDAIVCIECSEHLHDKARFLIDCHNLLSPGGTLALCAWTSGDPPYTGAQCEMQREIEEAMLLPSLAQTGEYLRWATDAGFENICSWDISEQVKRTWRICDQTVQTPMVQTWAKLAPFHVKQFVAAFARMSEAYDAGALKYVMFSAKRAH